MPSGPSRLELIYRKGREGRKGMRMGEAKPKRTRRAQRNEDGRSKTYHGVVMTEEVPNERENGFCCRSAYGSAPAYGSVVLV
jgi:hypothetical protein